MPVPVPGPVTVPVGDPQNYDQTGGLGGVTSTAYPVGPKHDSQIDGRDAAGSVLTNTAGKLVFLAVDLELK